MMAYLARVLSGALIAFAASRAVEAQIRAQTIRGRVTSDGAPIAAADVIITIAPTTESITTKSDSSGAFRVPIPNPTGEYILYVSSIGHRPIRRRVTMAANDTVATIEVVLSTAATAVAAVRVQASHPRPPVSLGNDGRAGTSGTDKTFDGVGGMLPPDTQGNIESMASTIPGLSTAGGGISAFGLGTDANSTVLNGLAFAGSDVPRDARTATRFRTSPWDPTIGGFSGVQTSISLLPGSNITTRKGHVTLDAPELQAVDHGAERLGQRVTNVALDEGGSGAVALDRAFYNLGLHIARQSAPMASLGDLDAPSLIRAGVSPDSAARAVQAAAGLGIPVAAGGVRGDRTTTTGSFMERVDRAPSAPARANGPPGPTLAVTGFGKYSWSDATSLSPTSAIASSGRVTNGLAGLQGLYSRYFGPNGDYINETTSAFSVSASHGSPYSNVPGADVTVASDDGIGSIALGGNGALEIDSRSWTWETINQTTFLAGGHESLPIKLYLQSRLDGYTQSTPANSLGQFTYASLADLAANRPSSYSRTLGASNASGGEWQGAAALGGSWIHNSLAVTGGTRVDANVFTAEPIGDPAVDQSFGVRTHGAPNEISLSPRLGFVWRYTPTIGYVTYAGNGSNFNRGQAQIRGGVGKFRGSIAPTLLASPTTLDGLPGEARQLLCIGTAVPEANWQAFGEGGAAPTTCAGGSPIFADTARSVSIVDRSYQPAESWRGNLGWTTSQFLDSYLSLDATYSYTTHVPGSEDLNFEGVPRFTLGDEGDRPVYADASSIVSSSGIVSFADSRRVAQYGAVSDRVSDLHADARQYTATVMPNIPFTAGVIVLSYTLTDARTQSRGFDANTAGDPRVAEWAPSASMPRHTIMAQWVHAFAGPHLVASAYFRAMSGLHFTPIVAGDVNGDGSSDDRAFIFDPAHATDPAVTNGVASLLHNGPAAARDCLSTQLGQLAARNSCTGPWGSAMNASFMFFDLPHLDGRTRLSVYFANITSGADQLLHGGNALRGWGVVPLPDPVLYQVRGFDPAARQFIYEVNPRFGSSSPAATIRRNPFRVTIDVEVGLGATNDMQRVEQTIRERASLVDTRASADSIKARYLRSAGTDIYAQMLRMSDSLALSRAQMEKFQARQRVLKQRADSIYAVLASYLANLPPKYDVAEAAKRVSDTRDSLWVVIRGERAFVLETLTPAQVRLLPALGLREMIMSPASRSMFFAGGWT